MGMKARPKEAKACPICGSKRPHRSHRPIDCLEVVKAEREDFRGLVESLASCALFALKFLDTSGGGGFMFKPKTGEIKPWQDDFMDALDKTGYVVDREKYWADRDKKKRRRR